VESLVSYIAGNLGLSSKPYLGAVAGPARLSKRENTHSVRVSAAGTQITSGLATDLEHNPALNGPQWYGQYGGIGISGKMIRDGSVRQSLAYITDPLKAADWRFKPASKLPLHVEQAKFCQKAFIKSLAWQAFIERTAFDYSADGFSLSEFTYDNAKIDPAMFPNHPGRGRAILPTGFWEIPANTVDRWYQSESNSLMVDRIRQWSPNSDVDVVGFRDLDIANILRFTWKQKAAYFAGLAQLRGSYGPWKAKIAFMTIDAIKHERRGVGTPILILGEEASEDDIAAAQQCLQDMRTNSQGYAIFPSGWKLEWDTGSKTEGTDLQQAITRCDIAIAYNVSAAFMMLGINTATGSFALGSTQQGQYHLFIAAQAAFIESIFTMGCDGWSPVRRILELNYGEVDELPTLVAKNLPTRPWNDVIKNMISAKQAGMLRMDEPTYDEVRSILQLAPEDDSTLETKPEPVAMPPMMASPEPDSEDDDETEDEPEETEDDE
jgi:hypothetical protein